MTKKLSTYPFRLFVQLIVAASLFLIIGCSSKIDKVEKRVIGLWHWEPEMVMGIKDFPDIRISLEFFSDKTFLMKLIIDTKQLKALEGSLNNSETGVTVLGETYGKWEVLNDLRIKLAMEGSTVQNKYMEMWHIFVGRSKIITGDFKDIYLQILFPDAAKYTEPRLFHGIFTGHKK